MSVTLYSKPNCVQCTATKRALDKRGIAYTVIDVSVDAEALALIQAKGFMQVPVVAIDGAVKDDQHRGPATYVYEWSGFRPDLLDQLPLFS